MQKAVYCWFLLFVLIRHGLRGGSGPQRLIEALGKETGNPIVAFHRPSFFPSCDDWDVYYERGRRIK
jgi:hypothetical protein